MVERRQTKRLTFIVLFLGLAALITFFRLMPLGSYGADLESVAGDGLARFGAVSAWGPFPVPDFMLCLTFAWVLRRPDLIPAPLIVVYFFFEDIMLLRPPGLWALVVLLGSEFLRRRSEQFRGFGFWLEYLLVTGLLVVMFLAERAILAIVIVPQVPLGLSFIHLLGTVLLYPVVVALTHFIFGLRKPATGEVDSLGQRL